LVILSGVVVSLLEAWSGWDLFCPFGVASLHAVHIIANLGWISLWKSDW
jgi:hypothetical protein